MELNNIKSNESKKRNNALSAAAMFLPKKIQFLIVVVFIYLVVSLICDIINLVLWIV